MQHTISRRFVSFGVWRYAATAASLLYFLWRTLFSAHAAVDESKFIGKTSWDNPPFMKNILALSWGASPDLEPGNLYWQYGSFFTNAQNMASAKSTALAIQNSGKVPFGGAQRWENTYVRSFPPGTFPGAPSWVDGKFANKPEFRAWATFIRNHPQYNDVANDGGIMPTGWRSWGGSWGHISPLMTLNPVDIPSGMTGNTWGDFYAYRWGQTAVLSGAWGIGLSDFTDSHPHEPVYRHDFNPGIIAAFEQWSGIQVPGATVSARAAYINNNLINKWTDFWSEGYGKFYAALIREIEKGTHHPAVIYNQGALWPGIRRLLAFDFRLIDKYVPSAKYIVQWDAHVMQADRSGKSMSSYVGVMGTAYARDPDERIGPNLSSDDPDFWNGVNKFWSQLSAADRRERGMKELKKEWLESAWTHIADSSGKVRRGPAFFLRNYWDSGSIPAQWETLLRSIKPTRPYGLAFYYSTAIEKAYERWIAGNNRQPSDAYPGDPLGVMIDLKDTQAVPFAYYVSDIALATLQPSAYPAGWIVIKGNDPSTGADLLPSGERQKLESIAPIVRTATAAKGFNNSLKLPAGITGFAFFDQNDRLIVAASNLVNKDTRTASVALKLPSGSYKATDLFTNEVIPFRSEGSVAAFSVTIGRWDTRFFAVTTSGGAGLRNIDARGQIWNQRASRNLLTP